MKEPIPKVLTAPSTEPEIQVGIVLAEDSKKSIVISAIGNDFSILTSKGGSNLKSTKSLEDKSNR